MSALLLPLLSLLATAYCCSFCEAHCSRQNQPMTPGPVSHNLHLMCNFRSGCLVALHVQGVTSPWHWNNFSIQCSWTTKSDLTHWLHLWWLLSSEMSHHAVSQTSTDIGRNLLLPSSYSFIYLMGPTEQLPIFVTWRWRQPTFCFHPFSDVP